MLKKSKTELEPKEKTEKNGKSDEESDENEENEKPKMRHHFEHSEFKVENDFEIIELQSVRDSQTTEYDLSTDYDEDNFSMRSESGASKSIYQSETENEEATFDQEEEQEVSDAINMSDSTSRPGKISSQQITIVNLRQYGQNDKNHEVIELENFTLSTSNKKPTESYYDVYGDDEKEANDDDDDDEEIRF
jgi:hypothetical protein